MKADTEEECCNLVLCHKDDAKIFQCNENSLHNSEVKSRSDKENPNAILCDSRACEGYENRLADVKGDVEKESPDWDIAYNHLSAKGDSFEKNSAFYMDKSIMECYKDITYHAVKDICVDEGVPVQDKFLFDNGVDEKDPGTKDLVKVEDVKVDFLSIRIMETEKSKSKPLNVNPNKVEEQSDYYMGIQCDSKDLVVKEESDDYRMVKVSEMDRNVLDVSRSSAKDYSAMESDGKCVYGDLIGTGEVKNDAPPNITNKDSVMSLLNVHNSSAENDSNRCVSVDCDLMLREEIKNGALGKTANDITKESLTLGLTFSTENEDKLFNSSNDGCKEKSSQSLTGKKSSETVGDSNTGGQEVLLFETRSDLVSESEKSNKGMPEEKDSDDKNTNRINLSSVSASQESLKSDTAISKVSCDNCGSESGALSASGKNEKSQITDSENHEPKHKWFLGDPKEQTFSNMFQSDFGETSFSTAGPVSGLITYSGPIAYSGSLSVRSDSSNTSTRSFAFPVLQSEWNSSPVRMARAERRHLRKQKDWKRSFLCCRF